MHPNFTETPSSLGCGGFVPGVRRFSERVQLVTQWYDYSEKMIGTLFVRTGPSRAPTEVHAVPFVLTREVVAFVQRNVFLVWHRQQCLACVVELIALTASPSQPF